MCLFVEKNVSKFTKGERRFVTLERYGIVWIVRHTVGAHFETLEEQVGNSQGTLRFGFCIFTHLNLHVGMI